VFAVERDLEQLGCLERNVKKHGAGNVRIVAGEAPAALHGLPAPQSVFLGGSGGRLGELLESLPRPFVANLAVMRRVATVLERYPKAQVTEVAAARSSKLPGGHRLAALNPVFIVEVPA